MQESDSGFEELFGLEFCWHVVLNRAPLIWKEEIGLFPRKVREKSCSPESKELPFVQKFITCGRPEMS
ncbi:conserved hypothetical protein [Ricinus communis]|uniref:Uncharacterized protein n=1 Tax=Ricinus communis TaxID=3988 RepID=B9RTS4_RICCO|nr:conserved hypothetical protein [Ricinus communis]